VGDGVRPGVVAVAHGWLRSASGGAAELADALDLGSSGATHGSQVPHRHLYAFRANVTCVTPVGEDAASIS
jgi:hypothetical protein